MKHSVSEYNNKMTTQHRHAHTHSYIGCLVFHLDGMTLTHLVMAEAQISQY